MGVDVGAGSVARRGSSTIICCVAVVNGPGIDFPGTGKVIDFIYLMKLEVASTRQPLISLW
ncbi:hypothetical protein D8674_008163 [Pyrus ussuriensis x Pyrus communis]|uniref:Uncharacterized protein n=1 Tax=Pyrus ussuriensis x Pyrus communis TaxID=2448454 RepID=A0A5N5I4W9_9ROSA|nr:hypothetical protein D8674_008163 [Pyrus ussuriensis x Pyrus communis]